MSRVASELAHLFGALKAPAAAHALPKLADRAREESWSYERFAEALLSTEVSSRDSHGGEGRIKAARFPARKTLEEFDFTFQRSVKKTVVEHLGQLDFLHARENVILLGPPGTGKTHLAIAVSIRACLAGQRVQFATATQWVARLSEAKRQGSLEAELRRLSFVPFIVVDEVGYIPSDPEAANLMFSLVSSRYERASMIVTSIKPFSAWGEIFGDRRIGPGQVAVAHLEFTGRTRGAIRRGVVQELRLTNTTPGRAGPRRVEEVPAAARVVRRAAAVLGPPLEGDRWVAADGCCTARRHVWATQPFGGRLFNAQRFAIDWERLDPNGRLWTGDEKVLTNWAGYGQRILAVADGTVVRALDGLPNQVPGALPTSISITEADGNAVFLPLRDGRIVFYAHMIPGSVRVRAGDPVRPCQVQGLVGNSGNSSAPHLHLHVVNRNAILAANGLPYVFDRYAITGKVASTAAFSHAEAPGTPVRLGTVQTGARRDELALDQTIVTWPSG